MRKAEGHIIEGWPLPARSLPLQAATAALLGSVALHAMLLSLVAWRGADGLARPASSAPAEFSLVTSGDLFEVQRPSREQSATQAALEPPTIAPNSASRIDQPAADEAVVSEPGIAPHADSRPAPAPETTTVLRGSVTELARLPPRDPAATDALQAQPADSVGAGEIVAARPISPSPSPVATAEAERQASREVAVSAVRPAITTSARPTSPEPAPPLDHVAEEPVRQAVAAEPAPLAAVRSSEAPAEVNASPAPETVQAASAARPAAQPATSRPRSTPVPEPVASPGSQALAARAADTRVAPVENQAEAGIVAETSVSAAEVPSRRLETAAAENVASAEPAGRTAVSPFASAARAPKPATAEAEEPAPALQLSPAPGEAALRDSATAIPARSPAPPSVAVAVASPAPAVEASSPAIVEEDPASVLQTSQRPGKIAPRDLASTVPVENPAQPRIAAATASTAVSPSVVDAPPPVAAARLDAAQSASISLGGTRPAVAPRSETVAMAAPAGRTVAAAVAPQASTPTSSEARPAPRQGSPAERTAAIRPDAAPPAVAARDVAPMQGATSLRPNDASPGTAASTSPILAARVETEAAAPRAMPPVSAGTARTSEPIRSAEATPARPVTDHAMAVRSFVSTYDGGDCFLLATNEVSDDSAAISGFGASADPFVTFNDTFTTMQGFEADLGVRQVSQAHCPLISLLKSRGRPLPETLIDLTSSSIVSGGLVDGKIVPESGEVDPSASPLLFLIDDAGQVHDARRFLQAGPDGWLFSFPLTLTGEADEAPVLLLAVFGVEPEERPEPFTSLRIEDFARQLDELLDTFSLAYLTVRE